MTFPVLNSISSYFNQTRESALFAAPENVQVSTAISRKVGGLAGDRWNQQQLSQDRYREKMGGYAPFYSLVTLEQGTKLAQISFKVAYEAIRSLDELADFTDQGGVKDPLKSIEKSRCRLRKHDLPFANCMECLADLFVEAYVNQSDTIKSSLVDSVRGDQEETAALFHPVNSARHHLSFFVDVLMGSHINLIGQTLKANIMHIAANLLDEADCPDKAFEDKEKNPFGRFLFVIITCMEVYQEELQNISCLPEEDQKECYSAVFANLSSDFMRKLFPRGEEDLQLFHPTLPFVKLAKTFLWKKIEAALPPLMERLYQETRPLADEKGGWKKALHSRIKGIEPDQLLKLPSFFFDRALVKDKGKNIEALESIFRHFFDKKGFPSEDVENLSVYFVKFIQACLLTKEPGLQKIGGFVERYAMERILFHVSQCDLGEDNLSFPVYHLKKGIEGGFFNILLKKMAGKNVTPQAQSAAIDCLLAPLGLNTQEAFPLPPLIKEKMWQGIDHRLKNKLPRAILDRMPKWSALRAKEANKKDLADWIGDPSLSKISDHLSRLGVEQLFVVMQSIPSFSKKIKELLPFLVLSDDQESAIDAQWEMLWKEEKMVELLKELTHECLDALLLQMIRDCHKHYLRDVHHFPFLSQTILLGDFFSLDGKDNESEELDVSCEDQMSHSFAQWLINACIKSVSSFKIEGDNSHEEENVEKAIHLKNRIHHGIDLDQVKKDRAELTLLWPEIEKNWTSFAFQLLNILGYQSADDLPLPNRQLQLALWKQLNQQLARVLFEQLSDFLLPFLGRKAREAQITIYPHGHMMRQGCQLLAKEMVNHLHDQFANQLNDLPTEIKTGEDGLVLMSKEAGQQGVKILQEMVASKYPVYQPILRFLTSYFEGIFIKIASEIGKIGDKECQALSSLLQKTQQECVECEDQHLASSEETLKKEEILARFIDALFAKWGVELPHDLFGVPLFLQSKILRQVKAHIAKGALALHQAEHRIRSHVIQPNKVALDLPTSKVQKAALGLTRYVLDKVIHKLTDPLKGQDHLISSCYDRISSSLNKKQNGEITHLFQEMLVKKIPTPFVLKLFDLLHHQSAHSYKEQLSDWLNPLLTDTMIRHLTPLLDREKEEQAQFEQALVIRTFSILTAHLKDLNHPFNKKKGRGDQILRQEERRKKFYQEQTNLIFDLFFPNGNKDISDLLSDFKINEKQRDKIFTSAKDFVAQQLPLAIESVLNPETATTLLKTLFEKMIHTFDEPIHLKEPSQNKGLSPQERAEERRLDRKVGAFVVQAAKLLDLPVELVGKLPWWMPGKNQIERLEKGVYESIGGSIRQRFNGDFFATILPNVLSALAERKHVRMTNQEISADIKERECELRELEKKVAQRLPVYARHYLAARLDRATDLFTHPVMAFCRTVVVSISSFVFITLCGSLFRFLKIDRWIADFLYNAIHHRSEKLHSLFSQFDYHENVIFREIEAFEECLIKNGTE